MDKIIQELKLIVDEYLRNHYDWPSNAADKIIFKTTKKEFEADLTLVIFPIAKILGQNPMQLGQSLSEYINKTVDVVSHCELVKGFLNVQLNSRFWTSFLLQMVDNPSYGALAKKDELVMVEYSSPNTNKPLHLGHIRNILIGWSCSKILEFAGFNVVKTQIVNDRGIAICKSMLAWQLFGAGETPESTGIKGDQLVGKYYVAFEKAFRAEYAEWQLSDEGAEAYESIAKANESKEVFFKRFKNQYFNTHSTLGQKATDTLLAWESGEPETRKLWKKMNDWVYAGFNETYAKLGVSFDKLYYESDTWKLGKTHVLEGVEKSLFTQREDGSIWVDLTDVGMDEKILLRSNGTSVYITQDIGTAMLRNEDFQPQSMIYVVADEQNYHFKVLFEVLKKMEEPYAERLYHLSYGMVDLPSGRMKSREGTVVDADDLVAEVIQLAADTMTEKGAIADLPESEQQKIAQKIGLAALKFFILKVNPKKKMIYDPSAAIDMQGQTGPYVQNAYVRIQSILRKLSIEVDHGAANAYTAAVSLEKELLKQLAIFPNIIAESAKALDPSAIANYLYELAKAYHRFYHEMPILSAETNEAKNYRLLLSRAVANVLHRGMDLLGIEMPDKM